MKPVSDSTRPDVVLSVQSGPDSRTTLVLDLDGGADSAENVDLGGAHEADLLFARIGEGGFDCAGDRSVGLKVCARARRVITVGRTAACTRMPPCGTRRRCIYPMALNRLPAVRRRIGADQ